MASSTAGGAANGLNILGGVAGIAGNLITSQQGKQDKGISGGQEDPAIAALRKRLAAQNAQTAMSVAASQQGVNPALAQRNAQQALAQQQVQTNSALAQGNLQSTLASRAATRGQQHQQIAGTAGAIGQGLVGLGTSIGAQSAFEAAGTPAAGGTGTGMTALAAPTASMSAPSPAQEQSSMAALQAAAPAPGLMGANEAIGAPSPELAALQATLPNMNGQPQGIPQMRGGEAQVMGGPLGPQAGAPPQAIAAPPLQEVALAQPVAATPPPQAAAIQNGPSPLGQMQMQGNEPQVTPQAVPTTQQLPEIGQVTMGAQEPLALTTAQSVQALPPEVFDDPTNSSIEQLAANAEQRGNPEMAEVFRRALLQRVSGL